MSKRTPQQTQATGDVPPQDGHARLESLYEHMRRLSQLAQSRARDGAPEGPPGPSAGELALCLELLAEQAGQVLDALSPPAGREAAHTPRHIYEAPAGDTPALHTAKAQGDFCFGLTVAQIDALQTLATQLSAHGDVVTGSGDAAFADQTLPTIGHAIFEEAEALRGILGQVSTQRLGNRVGEARPVYGAAPVRARPTHGPTDTPLPSPAFPARRQNAATLH
ncbi:hypothetical protein FKV24_006110 [Lysobacter maris]|uniref:XAC0095-like domain-containing protein n=1 Tax=Marilutibacter maris TaxID=1605891 RepID=A0A508AV27_9GAMM|nr:hypothetical protein [Lysobacter maris]KAB8193911.1 hypothetical protein FKV24_006110 [Lysobacter maris]